MVNPTATCHKKGTIAAEIRVDGVCTAAAIRGEALLEEKKKGNVPYRVPGLAVLRRKESIG